MQVSPFVVLVVLVAGLAHASWNAVMKYLDDANDAFVLLNLGGGLGALGLLVTAGFPRVAALSFVGLSIALHLAYQLALKEAYHHADFSTSYPIARGVAPMLVSLAGVVLAHERLRAWSLLGVVAVVTGVLLLSSWRTWRGASARWALLTGVAIAAYTVCDGFGVRRAGNTAAYVGLLLTVQSSAWVVMGLRRRAHRVVAVRPLTWGIGAGLLSVVAYGLVLWAQTRAPLGVVSALRETGVLWAAVFGALVFHEGRLRTLLVPSAVIALGVACLSIS